MLAKSQASDFKPITFEAKPDLELINYQICVRAFQTVLENYNFAFAQLWGIMDTWRMV